MLWCRSLDIAIVSYSYIGNKQASFVGIMDASQGCCDCYSYFFFSRCLWASLLFCISLSLFLLLVPLFSTTVIISSTIVIVITITIY